MVRLNHMSSKTFMYPINVLLINVYRISTSLRRSFLNIAVVHAFYDSEVGHGHDVFCFHRDPIFQAGSRAFPAAKRDERQVSFDRGRRVTIY